MRLCEIQLGKLDILFVINSNATSQTYTKNSQNIPEENKQTIYTTHINNNILISFPQIYTTKVGIFETRKKSWFTNFVFNYSDYFHFLRLFSGGWGIDVVSFAGIRWNESFHYNFSNLVELWYFYSQQKWVSIKKFIMLCHKVASLNAKLSKMKRVQQWNAFSIRGFIPRMFVTNLSMVQRFSISISFVKLLEIVIAVIFDLKATINSNCKHSAHDFMQINMLIHLNSWSDCISIWLRWR